VKTYHFTVLSAPYLKTTFYYSPLSGHGFCSPNFSNSPRLLPDSLQQRVKWEIFFPYVMILKRSWEKILPKRNPCQSSKQRYCISASSLSLMVNSLGSKLSPTTKSGRRSSLTEIYFWQSPAALLMSMWSPVLRDVITITASASQLIIYMYWVRFPIGWGTLILGCNSARYQALQDCDNSLSVKMEKKGNFNLLHNFHNKKNLQRNSEFKEWMNNELLCFEFVPTHSIHALPSSPLISWLYHSQMIAKSRKV